MKKILFVCTGNTCRSPMAMAVLREMAARGQLSSVEADSAGLACTGGSISSNSVEALRKIGIEFNDYRSKQVTSVMLDNADLIVTMTAAHKEFLLNAGIPSEKVLVLAGGVPDPYGGDQATYDRILSVIRDGISRLAEEGRLS